jgi:hypothetical protein
MHKPISYVTLVLLVLLSAVACGAKPALIDDLPVYPGAQTMERGQNSLADSVADAMQQSAGEQGLNAQFRFFTLPLDATWDGVKSYYDREMQGLNWKSEPSMAVEGGSFQAAGWSRGTGDSQQALVVGYVPDVSGEGAFAVLGLFGK